MLDDRTLQMPCQGKDAGGQWTQDLNTDSPWYDGGILDTPLGAVGRPAVARASRDRSHEITVPRRTTFFQAWTA